jgi:hypothetical protein
VCDREAEGICDCPLRFARDEMEPSRLQIQGKVLTVEQEQSDSEFNAITARLLRREALRRAAAELNTVSAPGHESMLERISTEVTAEAAERRVHANVILEPALQGGPSRS